MQWVAEQTMVDAWVAELAVARHEIEDAYALVAEAQRTGAELIAASAWASPAMAAFQAQREVWIDELARGERELRELDAQVARVRARLFLTGWEGVPG
jgi:hypothetical protein